MVCLIRIYAAREGLNSRVAGLLQAPDAPANQVAAALADLRENLSAEMRAVSEQHFLLLRMLLSPTQVPHPCCTMPSSFLNLLPRMHALQDCAELPCLTVPCMCSGTSIMRCLWEST